MDQSPADRAPIVVVAAVIERDGAVLLARRKPGGPHGGLWEFPGGKVEHGELPEQALARELYEEFGVAAEVGEFIVASVHAYAHVAVDLRAYAVRLPDGVPHMTDHDALAWVPVAELERYPMPAADVPIARALRERSGLDGRPTTEGY